MLAACEAPEIQIPEREILGGAFDVTERSIPLDRIFSGGPPKDGIPAIDDPHFLLADEADHLSDEDLVIGILLDGKAKAYPLRILAWHEVVNDQLGDTAVAVTFCPLTGSSIAFDRRAGDVERTFGISGWLYENNVLLYDRSDNSLWSQLGGGAVSGKAMGTSLESIPSVRTSWADWRARHPDTLVLSTETGAARDYERNPYRSYELSGSTMFPVGKRDTRVQAKELILGVTVGDTHKAYPFIELEVAGSTSISDRIGDREIRIHFDGRSAHATADDDSREPVDAFVVYWFAWSIFHPDTDVWTAARPSSRIPDRAEPSASRAEIKDTDSYWSSMGGAFAIDAANDDLSGSGLYVITGTVENTSETPLRRVDFKFELLDGRGNTVYTEQGVNRLAEEDIMLDAKALAEKAEADVLTIAPGSTDKFRMLFIGSEIPKFARSRVSVIATH